MLNYSHLLHPYIKVCHTLPMCVAALSLLFAGCSDDTFDDFYNNNNGNLTFEVSAPGSWMEIKSRAGEGCPDKVKITRMESSDNQQLFLITEERNSPDSVVKMSRGALVESVAAIASIGISAITYNSETDIPSRPPLFCNSVLSKAGGTLIVNGSQLKWDDISEGNVRFYAYAPHSDNANSAISHSASDEVGAPEITYTVPDVVAGQYDLLAYAGSYDPAAGATVNIAFNHILTAVTVSTGADMLAGKVTKVTLSGIKSSGKYNFADGSWTPDNAPDKDFVVEKNLALGSVENSEGNKEYTSSGKEIIGETGNLTFLMIPQTLGSDAKLTIEFTDAYGAQRTLTASLSGKEWTAGKKVNYSVSTTGIHVVPLVAVEGITSVPTSGFIPDVTVKTYAKKYKYTESGETAVETVSVPLDFEVGYKLNDADAAVFPATGEWGWEKVSELKDGNLTTGYKGNIMLDPRTEFTKMKAGFTGTEVGSPTSYSDLTGGGETANCYLIDAPGYYSFPTIYGNARGKNGADNPDAYTCNVSDEDIKKSGTKTEYILKKFKKHDGEVIKSPKIDEIASASLIWQDSPDLITDVHYDSNDGDGKVTFRVRPETLNQGNALIAVKNSSGTILWSWHIWVTHHKTDFNNTRVEVASRNPDDNYKFAFTSYNLGYCDPHGADNSERKFKLVFRVKNPLTNETTLVEPEATFSQDEILESVAGDNTYYQWGRKDPMPGGIWNQKTLDFAKDNTSNQSAQEQFDMQNKPIYPATDFTQNYPTSEPRNKSFGRGESGVTISQAIQNPNVFFMHDNTDNVRGTWDDYYRRHWHKGPSNSNYPASMTGDGTDHAIMNYWDSQLYKLGEKPDSKTGQGLGGSNGQFPTKTVYDPCPVGFCVPPVNAFSNISTVNVTKVNDKGYDISWQVPFDGAGTLTFPSTGLRDMGNRHIKRPSALDVHGVITNAAHSKLTFIASCSFCEDKIDEDKLVDNPYYTTGGACLIAYLDNRNDKTTVNVNTHSQNSYGLTVRPIHDTKIPVTTE